MRRELYPHLIAYLYFNNRKLEGEKENTRRKERRGEEKRLRGQGRRWKVEGEAALGRVCARREGREALGLA